MPLNDAAALAEPPLHAGALSAAKTVVLVDDVTGGHHQAWLLQFAHSFLRAGCRVQCLCPEPGWMAGEIEKRSPQHGSAFSAVLLDRPRFAGVPSLRLRNAAEAVARWRATSRATKAALGGSKPDLVFFAMFDGLFEFGVTPWLVDMLFPFPWATLYFHPGYDRKVGSRSPMRPRSDSCLRASGCRAVAVLDEGAADGLRRYLAPKQVITFPDFSVPAEPRPAAAWIGELRARADGRTIVVAAGSLTQRKGISTLLRLAQRKEMREFFFLFAGDFGWDSFGPAELPMWRKAVERPPENCVLRPGRIESDSEFDQLIAASDIVYAAYHDFRHSSNLLAKAAQFRHPIVVSRGYCMEERVRRFSLGEVVEQDNEDESLKALRALRGELESGMVPPARASGFEAYLREHSVARFEERLRDLLEAAGCA